jgi:hypothetical protein
VFGAAGDGHPPKAATANLIGKVSPAASVLSDNVVSSSSLGRNEETERKRGGRREETTLLTSLPAAAFCVGFSRLRDRYILLLGEEKEGGRSSCSTATTHTRLAGEDDRVRCDADTPHL